VARRAAVSPATVSRVVSGVAPVSPALAARVRAAARQLAYEPNRAARDLRTRRSRFVGLIVRSLASAGEAVLADAVLETLSAAGFTVLLAQSAGDGNREEAALRAFQGERAAGALVIPSRMAEAYRTTRQRRMPVVALDRAPEGFPGDCAVFDHGEVGRLATAHLASRGHRRIALIDAALDAPATARRAEGYQRAMAAAGLKVARGFVVTVSRAPSDASAAVDRLLAQRDPPTALLIASDPILTVAIETLRARGLAPGVDVALLCVGDGPWATTATPPLTSVTLPYGECGRIGARLLLDRLAGGSASRKRSLPPQLVVRASCGRSAGEVKLTSRG
jgi:LacI family transcriptional regulator